MHLRSSPKRGGSSAESGLILLNNPPFLETPSACLKTAQQISPTNGVQTILILGEGVLMVFLGVDLWPVGVLQQNQKSVVFNYESSSEIYACQRLANGNTFVGECNAGRLLELAPDGKVIKQIRLLPEGKDGGHPYMRTARRSAHGHYLVTHYGEQVVREY